MAGKRSLDVICIGRSSVDLYGDQIGGRLEDMASFSKYVGGCPTNISIGAARMGLVSALITRVGNEHMGRFIRETLENEGVRTDFVITDPHRLTALVILGISDRDTFPLIFYRDNCADMAINVDDIDPDFIASAQALVVTGTHLSTETTRAAILKAVHAAHAAGTKVIFDIDYRPVLWGLTDPGLGEDRFVASAAVSEVLRDILPLADVIVGTEEEVFIAGGTEQIMNALQAIRSVSDAAIVLKLGADGCAVLEGDIPDSLNELTIFPGFPVEVFNILGAGDAFLAGLLRGYLTGEGWEQSCRLANASGALVVSRHGCSPSIPSLVEIKKFIAEGSSHFRVREDAALEQLHWSTTRYDVKHELLAFAFDHRSQFAEFASENSLGEDSIGAFKLLCVQAVEATKDRWPTLGVGMLCDGRYGEDALNRVTGHDLWVGRPIEVPGSRPLTFEGGPNVADTLRSWPLAQCVKCLVQYHPDDEAGLKAKQDAALIQLADACRNSQHELLLEVIPPADLPRDGRTVSRAMSMIYSLGIFPDLWKLPSPVDEAEWKQWSNCIESHDPHCQGIVLLGFDAPEKDLMRVIANSANHAICKGFAVGRTVLGTVARAWFKGEMDDAAAVDEMMTRYNRLIVCWTQAREKFVQASRVTK